MTEKGGMVAWEIEVRRDLASPIPVNVGIIPFPENHADVEPLPFSRVASMPRPFTFT